MKFCHDSQSSSEFFSVLVAFDTVDNFFILEIFFSSWLLGPQGLLFYLPICSLPVSFTESSFKCKSVSGDDGNILYFDCGGDFPSIYIPELITLQYLKSVTFIACKLYFSRIHIKSVWKLLVTMFLLGVMEMP